MRNVLTEPLPSLRVKVQNIPNRKLVEMIRALQRILLDGGEESSQEFKADILRRQAILEAPLVQRGYLTQGQVNREYMEGVYKAEKKKRVF